jgi:hypothetical protein
MKGMSKKKHPITILARGMSQKNTRQVPFSSRQKTAAGATHNYLSVKKLSWHLIAPIIDVPFQRISPIGPQHFESKKS